MKLPAIALQAILGTAMLVACATPGLQQPEVKPLLAVRDGGAKADHYYQLGRYYQSKERVRDAAEAYRRAISLDERLAEAHNALGAIYAANGGFEQAIAELTAAITLDPSVPHFRNNLGYAYYLQGKAEEAIANFKAAAALDPSNPRTWNNMGLALARLGNIEKSTEAFARASALPAGGPAPRSAVPPTEARAPAGQVARDAAITGEITRVTESVALLEQLRPVAARPIPTLRLLEPAELKAPAELAAALASPATASAAKPVLEPVTEFAGWLVGLEQVQTIESAPLPMFQLVRVDPSISLLPPVTVSPPLERMSGYQWAFEPLPPIAWPMVASLAFLTIPPLPMATEPSPLTLVFPNENARDPDGSRVRGSSAGTLVVEVPSGAKVVALAPHAVELKWTGATVIARRATAPETGATDRLRLEISNGNGVTGMARKIGGMLMAVGLPKSLLTNEKPFGQRLTSIQYRDGREGAAASLSARLPNRPATARNDRLRADIDVRLVLGLDFPSEFALVEPASDDARWVGAMSTIDGRSVK